MPLVLRTKHACLGSARLALALSLSTTPCGPVTPRVVRLVFVNEADATPQTLDEAAAEASAIWEAAGLNVTWEVAPLEARAADDTTVMVIIRRTLLPAAGHSPAPPAGGSPLGRIVFGTDDRPTRLIEVSFEGLTSLVMAGSHFGRPVEKLPAVTQWQLLGRGLGRVVAHELGHWVAGRGHVHAGLMKPGFTGPDLIQQVAPPLPPGWTSCDPTPDTR